MKTFIKWSGNKSKHLRHILPHIPEFSGTYIEPFVGSGALFLKLEPKKWIINDLNKDLINCWKTVKNHPDELISNFIAFGKKFKPMSKDKKTNFCINVTNKIERMKYDIKRASIYMLMKYCAFMGNIMFNNKLYFPSLELNIRINNRCYFLESNCYENIRQLSKYLKKSNGKFYNLDYKEVLAKANKDDFIFIDPPYIEDHNYQFNYNKNERIDQTFVRELYDELKKLDKKKVKWIMTQADASNL